MQEMDQGIPQLIGDNYSYSRGDNYSYSRPVTQGPPSAS
jgi:hypothetical protein